MATLLAVDLGLRTGLACYTGEGRLSWYRSSHFGQPAILRQAIPGIFADCRDLHWLAIEGGGPLADLWRRAAERQGGEVLQISAEHWRRKLLLPRQQRSGPDAKRHAGELARRVIDWSQARRPTVLRHDTAEAILTGLYAVWRVGWLDEIPAPLRG